MPEARSVCKALPTSALVRGAPPLAPYCLQRTACPAPSSTRTIVHKCSSRRPHVLVTPSAWAHAFPFSPTLSLPRTHLHTPVLPPPYRPRARPRHHTAPLVRSPPPACYAKLRPPPPLRVHARPVPEPRRRPAPRRLLGATTTRTAASYSHTLPRWATDLRAREHDVTPHTARARPPTKELCAAHRRALLCAAHPRRHTHAHTSTPSYRSPPRDPPPPPHCSTRSLATAGMLR